MADLARADLRVSVLGQRKSLYHLRGAMRSCSPALRGAATDEARLRRRAVLRVVVQQEEETGPLSRRPAPLVASAQMAGAQLNRLAAWSRRHH